jgi:hypothetical protein
VVSYLQTGKKQEALALTDEGIRNAGEFAHIYQRLREQVEK